MIFINSTLKEVSEVFMELSLENLYSYILSPSMYIETVGKIDEMFVNATPFINENSWILDGKRYKGNALMYGKILENDCSGCTWNIEDFRGLIEFL